MLSTGRGRTNKRLFNSGNSAGVSSTGDNRNAANETAALSTETIPRLLTVDEVAEILRCSRSTVYSLISSAKIVGLRIGSHSGGIRVSAEDLQAYLDSCRVEPAPKRWPGRLPKLKHLRI